MRQVRWASWMVGLAMALAVCGVRPVAADIRSDQAAAIVEWPSVIFVGVGDILGNDFVLDTTIQITNTSTEAQRVWCFYENANAHCSNTGEVCSPELATLIGGELNSQCCDGDFCGICQPGWNETDFHIQITPRQPLGWLASQGMSGFDFSPVPPKDFGKFPIDGVHNFGINGSSNAGSRIPPVPERPFNGSLRCVAVDDNDTPVDHNVLKGEETLTFFRSGENDDISVAKSNAIGIQAIPGAVNDDSVLVLGGPTPEYNGCANFLILDHFFDGATNPVVENFDPDSHITTVLTLVPCCQDFLRQIPGSAIVQYLVYNEFEQRFSTSRSVECKQILPLSLIDTTQPERSIFNAGVAGTLTGQTVMNPVLRTEGEPPTVQCGLIGVATEIHDVTEPPPLAEVNLHFRGERGENPDSRVEDDIFLPH